MKSLRYYVNKEKARRYRNRQRAQNYELGDFSYGSRNNRHKQYTWKECREILRHDILDRKLARKLGRSVMAIQVKRNGLLTQ